MATLTTSSSRTDSAVDRSAAVLASVRLSGFGTALPETRLTNQELTRTLDTSDEWITTRTGIHSRQHAEDETTASLALDAARTALEDADLGADDVDLLIVATSTPDSPCPPTASRVASELGVVGGSFDINGACTGFVHALLS